MATTFGASPRSGFGECGGSIGTQELPEVGDEEHGVGTGEAGVERLSGVEVAGDEFEVVLSGEQSSDGVGVLVPSHGADLPVLALAYQEVSGDGPSLGAGDAGYDEEFLARGHTYS